MYYAAAQVMPPTLTQVHRTIYHMKEENDDIAEIPDTMGGATSQTETILDSQILLFDNRIKSDIGWSHLILL